MDEIYLQFLSKVRTKDDARTLISEIDLLLAGLYEYEEVGVDSVLKNSVRLWVSSLISKYWGDSRNKREEFLKELKSKIEALRPVNLTLAIEPTESTLDKIYSKIYELIGGNFVIDLEYNRKILGGIQISFNGVYRDYSILRLLSNEKEGMGAKIRELMD